MFETIRKKGFQVVTLHHAEAILQHDLTQAAQELESVLAEIELPVAELIRGGGGEGKLTQRMRRLLADTYGWKRHSFEIRKIVDGVEKECISHIMDHVKTFERGTVALEIEWNNKDPFFDRDLENFKRLHADGVISLGAIVTRGESLQESLRDAVEQFATDQKISSIEQLQGYYSPTVRQIRYINQCTRRHESFARGWAQAFVADKFGEATTHWRKLQDRVQRGVGNPCPLLLIGLPKELLLAGKRKK